MIIKIIEYLKSILYHEDEGDDSFNVYLDLDDDNIFTEDDLIGQIPNGHIQYNLNDGNYVPISANDGNIDDDESEIFADCGEYNIWAADFEYLGIFEKALPADKGNPLSTYNDIPWGPERWCAWNQYINADGDDDPNTNCFLDTNTEINDMGGYGGPNGGWQRNPR